MNGIWANRLIAGTKTREQCIKAGRFEGVKKALAGRVESGEISPEKYKEITGEIYEESEAK